MPRLRYTRRAKADLIQIGDTTLAAWGEAQYIRYLDSLDHVLALIARYPLMGTAFWPSRPTWRRLPHGSHVILYTLDDRAVTIRRIKHKHELLVTLE